VLLGFMRVDHAPLAQSGLNQQKQQVFLLQLEAPEQPVWVEGDPILLAEMLANLIDNALRYAKGADSIKLIVTSTPPTFSVEDNGSGILADEQGAGI
jgi:two-component system, OmpR family, sensor histidine kinase TctE